jgi:hypothetical protein
MSRESRILAGILLVVVPTVMYGGLTLLSLLTGGGPGYADNRACKKRLSLSRIPHNTSTRRR